MWLYKPIWKWQWLYLKKLFSSCVSFLFFYWVYFVSSYCQSFYSPVLNEFSASSDRSFLWCPPKVYDQCIMSVHMAWVGSTSLPKDIDWWSLQSTASWLFVPIHELDVPQQWWIIPVGITYCCCSMIGFKFPRIGLKRILKTSNN